jgi:zinc transporter, ZIP family
LAAFLAALTAGAGFTIAALAGLFRTTSGDWTRSLAVSAAAGILIGVSFVEILPEAFERGGATAAPVGFVVGFGALFVLESLTKGHTHHTFGEELDHRSLTPFIAGLLVHNVIDGMVIATAALLSTAASAGVSIGVLIHQLPVGLSFAAVVSARGPSRRFALGWAALLGLCIPLGAGAIVLIPTAGGGGLGATLGIAGGALAYIGAGHLLPEAQSEHSSRLAALFFPLALALTALLFLGVLPAE